MKIKHYNKGDTVIYKTTNKKAIILDYAYVDYLDEYRYLIRVEDDASSVKIVYHVDLRRKK